MEYAQQEVPDFNKYRGQNADDVINELQNLGYNPVKFGTNVLTRAQPLPAISDSCTVHVYVDSINNTVAQIQTK